MGVLWMFQAEYTNSLKLAGQEPRTRTERSDWTSAEGIRAVNHATVTGEVCVVGAGANLDSSSLET
jgi:hypothetical protein